MNKYKKLVNNSIIFTIGSFGSKLISFLMVPLYTHLLSTSEYGTVDVMNVTIGLLIPVFTLELGQAALRFSIETKDKIKQNIIFSNITTHALIVTVVILMSVPFLQHLHIFENYTIMFILLLILRIYNNLLAQYIRGIGKVKEFAINGILMSLVTVFSNIFFLILLNYKIEGYIFSLILAALASNIYLLYTTNSIARLKMYNGNKVVLKEMLRFSIPIIPTSAIWWIINSSTRYFILYFIGTEGNGIYAVANKIPAVISIATGIFAQAWQLSSFEEYESTTRDKFYTKTFNVYWFFLFTFGSFILVILKPMISIIVEESFYISWQVAPLLLLAVIYQSFSSFLGTNYTASKKTKGSFTTAIFAGIVSLLSSIFLIPKLGLIGAGLSSSLSFFAMFIIRLIDTRKYVVIKLNAKSFILTNAIFVFQIFILFKMNDTKLFIVQIILFCLLLVVNKSKLHSFTSTLKKLITKYFLKRH